ncbi:Flagellar-associated PapD-like [Novymonas esmeraldas]|uniref:Flagellar-associated PapD-like n=1 Tax=Novymonas esmeraldas TaxID=1808958 RepID=A0AAW0EYG2_9TRYP
MATSTTTAAAEGERFRPVVFLLGSHTPDHLDAATVARLLQPRFRSDDYYIVNATAAPAQDAAGAPGDGRKNAAGDAAANAGPTTPLDKISFAVQSALAKIDAARREARQAAAQAIAAQLSALQADYMDDGLSEAEALAAAQAELQERTNSDDDGGASDAGDDNRRLPPCVCVVNVPLFPGEVARVAQDVPGVAAVLLLESPCTVRELVAAPGATARKSSMVSAGAHVPSERGKGRGPGAGASATAFASTSKQQGGAGAEEVLATLARAAAAQSYNSGLQDVLLQHVAYPAESSAGAGASGQTASVYRPTVPAAQFLSTVHALMLRVLASWVRYDTWRARRSLVQVPAYTALIDAEAALTAVAVDDAAAATSGGERRSSKRKSGGPGATAARDGSVQLSTSAEPPTTALCPTSMAEVAAEQFEYGASMQRWQAAAAAASASASSPSSSAGALAAAAAVQACLRGCVSQVASEQGPSTLRTNADASAAQLAEDVANACVTCRVAAAASIGAPPSPAGGGAATASVDSTDAALPLPCGVTPASHPAAAPVTADTVEEAVARALVAEAGPAVLPSVSTALVATAGGGDALNWLRDALVARDQHGWHAAVQNWRETPLYCLHQPAFDVGVPRTQHVAHLLDSHTSFPRFFREEAYLETEGHHYAPSSLGDPSEEEEEEEDTSVDSSDDDDDDDGNSASDVSHDSSGGAVAGAPPMLASTLSRSPLPPPPPTGPVIDHVDVVRQHLVRRRVLEQVRQGHARPPVQELVGGGGGGGSCRAVVTETQWMRAADGTLIEVARTAANSAQVRCGILDAGSRVQAGFTLECPTADAVAAPKVAAGDAAVAPLPEPLVASGVRGFVTLGRQLRVVTEVVADNANAVAQASRAAAVAAAKEVAAAQYEAQFSRAGKGAKARDKTAPAAQLTLEQITETLLAALPPPPPQAEDDRASGVAAPPVMRVFASFPQHDCVMTATVSSSGVPGVHVRCLAPSRYTAPRPLRRGLMQVQTWKDGELAAVELARLHAVRVFLDGVLEVHSPDLVPGLRVLLHRSGSYVVASAAWQLAVSPDGCCALCESGDTRRVVHQMQRGHATAVTAPAVHRVEREDGLQLEMVDESTATSAGGLVRLRGVAQSNVRCIRFGDGVAVERGGGGGAVGTWTWRVAGVPAVHCDGVAHEIALAADDGDGDRLAYRPLTDSFALLVRDDGAAALRVAARVDCGRCRLSVFAHGDDTPTRGRGTFTVDCAYGGLYGSVGEGHVYRVSPFGRCSEELETGEEPRQRQLVLPPRYKRPRRKPAEVVLLPEYASPGFHRAIAGEDDHTDAPAPQDAAAPLHLCAAPPPLADVPSPSPAAASPYQALMPAHTPTAAAAPALPQPRCVAVLGDDARFAVLDAASWTEWVAWWRRHPHWRLAGAPTRTAAAGDGAASADARVFCLVKTPVVPHTLVPVTEAGAEDPQEPQPVVQECVLLSPSSEPAAASPPPPWWCTPGALTVAAAAAAAAAGGRTSMADETAEAVPPPPRAPSGGVERNDATLAEGRRVTRRPVGPAHHRGGSLNYWSSALSPPPVQPSPHSSSAENESTMPTVRAATGSPRVDAAARSSVTLGPVAASLAASDLLPSKVPLMRSYHSAADEHTGTNAASRFHSPSLEVQPRQVEFGNVLPGRRYAAVVRLTNTSTVPCRYRVRVAQLARPHLSVSYPRHFVAPGITTEVRLELSGDQPPGVTDTEVSVAHEGGTVDVGVWWCTTDEAHTARLGDGVSCLGWALRKAAIQHPQRRARDADLLDERDTLSDSDTARSIHAA